MCVAFSVYIFGKIVVCDTEILWMCMRVVAEIKNLKELLNLQLLDTGKQDKEFDIFVLAMHLWDQMQATRPLTLIVC